MGLWGAATYRVTNRIFITIFGQGIAFVTVFLVGAALIFWGLANLDKTVMTSVCPGSANSLKISFDPLNSIKLVADEVDVYNDLASHFMCSTTCPCLQTSASSSWTELTETEVNIFDRTLVQDRETIMNKLVFYTEAEAQANNVLTFETFDECFDAILKDRWVPTNVMHRTIMKAIPLRSDYKSAMDVLNYLYEDLGCSCFCLEHLFVWHQP